MAKKERITVDLEGELKELVAHGAEAEQRSVSNYVRRLISEAVRDQTEPQRAA
jgi:uncharacterized protein (DUF1778 family)